MRDLYILGSSWVVISRVISRVKWVITIVNLLTTPFITTHEPQSKTSREAYTCFGQGFCKGSAGSRVL